MLTRQQTLDWIAALRSGQYKQGAYTLHNSLLDSYCCLGVAAEINNLIVQMPTLSYLKHRSINLSLSSKEFTNVGTFDIMGIPPIMYKGNIFVSLADANDSGVPFTVIADHLEKYYLPLTK